MGMFDYVDYEMDCPYCGAKVNGFQSKDGVCYLNHLQPHEVRNFYSSCPSCDVWIECEYVPPAGMGKIVATASRRPKEGADMKPSDTSRIEMDWYPSDADKKD